MDGFKFIRDEMLNMTMDELAMKMNVSKQTVYMWESGKKKIPEKRLVELEKLSGIPQKYFLVESLSGMDILEIKYFKIRKDMDDTTFEFKEQHMGNAQTIRHMNVDKGLEQTLDYNMVSLEVANLQKKIEKIIYALEDDTNCLNDELININEKRNLFDRFADVVNGNKNIQLLHGIIRAMEIFFGIESKKELLEGEKTAFCKGLVSDAFPLIQDMLEVLYRYKDEEIRKEKDL